MANERPPRIRDVGAACEVKVGERKLGEVSQPRIRNVAAAPEVEVGERKLGEVSKPRIRDVAAAAKDEVGERELGEVSQPRIRDVVALLEAEVGERKLGEVSEPRIRDVAAAVKVEVGERKLGEESQPRIRHSQPTQSSNFCLALQELSQHGVISVGQHVGAAPGQRGRGGLLEVFAGASSGDVILHLQEAELVRYEGVREQEQPQGIGGFNRVFGLGSLPLYLDYSC
jgi:hypothetical protein